MLQLFLYTLLFFVFGWIGYTLMIEFRLVEIINFLTLLFSSLIYFNKWKLEGSKGLNEDFSTVYW